MKCSQALHSAKLSSCKSPRQNCYITFHSEGSTCLFIVHTNCSAIGTKFFFLCTNTYEYIVPVLNYTNKAAHAKKKRNFYSAWKKCFAMTPSQQSPCKLGLWMKVIFCPACPAGQEKLNMFTLTMHTLCNRITCAKKKFPFCWHAQANTSKHSQCMHAIFKKSLEVTRACLG